MPVFPFTQAIAAGAEFDPLPGWTQQFPETNGKIKLNHQATAVGLLATWLSGSRTLMQSTPVPAGGTAGVMPSDFAVPPLIEPVRAREKQQLLYRNPTGAPITITGQVDFGPAGGGRRR